MSQGDKTQLDRFKEAAREIGTDDDEERFNEKLGKLVGNGTNIAGHDLRRSRLLEKIEAQRKKNEGLLSKKTGHAVGEMLKSETAKLARLEKELQDLDT